jgi:hypothetical protein
MKIVELGKMFRPGTSHVYPPFKNGRYMEEYAYETLVSKQDEINTDLVYLPIFWTNLQNHPGFVQSRVKYEIVLHQVLQTFPKHTRFFTIVQHDDGPQLQLPKDTIIFGACTGTIPLPLIYEDKTNRLSQLERKEPDLFASFVGSLTHPVRQRMASAITLKPDIICRMQKAWNVKVPTEQADEFLDLTLRSKFCLAPRGYGRSSFRFFEAILMDTIPVYLWDDVEWLPYKEHLDYNSFSVSISDISKTYDILSGISEARYQAMKLELQKVKHWFTLEGMMEYVIGKIQ